MTHTEMNSGEQGSNSATDQSTDGVEPVLMVKCCYCHLVEVPVCHELIDEEEVFCQSCWSYIDIVNSDGDIQEYEYYDFQPDYE